MNRTKEQKVLNSYNLHMLAEHGYNINQSSQPKIFNACWNTVADPLKKKLSASELWEYIRIHILPAIARSKPIPTNYATNSVRETRGQILEVMA